MTNRQFCHPLGYLVGVAIGIGYLYGLIVIPGLDEELGHAANHLIALQQESGVISGCLKVLIGRVRVYSGNFLDVVLVVRPIVGYTPNHRVGRAHCGDSGGHGGQQ